MTKLQPPRGTRDLIENEAARFRRIDQTFAQLAKTYDFEEIVTPIFEFTHVFKRSLGETTDIVSKEMYTFEDRGGEQITLRPEGTAGVARAVLSNNMLHQLPLKLFYYGPMFRYERPQKGRYRQFFQFGVELFGAQSAIADAEVLALAHHFFEKMGLADRVQLELNTIGDIESRQHFKDKLVEYLTPFKKELSEDSQVRLEKNPLRILDSKDENDKKIVQTAPKFDDCLNDTSKKFFDEVLAAVTSIGLSYQLNSNLVRGLDYYCHTVFEFTTSELGSQNAVLSGGRYDGLIQAMGGPQTSGVGWGCGVDRIALLLPDEVSTGDSVAVIGIDEAGDAQVLPTLNLIRKAGIRAQTIYSGNMGKKMKKADQRHCNWAVLIGSQEVEQGVYQIKNLKTGEQIQVPKTQMANWLNSLRDNT
ncbi:MAG: histidine--tRNA ligase, partial [Pseudobdellovibrionaceae bacterium]